MYSQNDEEAVILRHFGNRVGRLLDIGAADGRTHSNSLALVERGWTGVLVEPSPSNADRLIATHADNDRVTVVLAAISPAGGLVKFWSSRDYISSLNPSHVNLWQTTTGARFNPILAASVTVADLLQSVPGPYEFITIDAEGSTLDIASALPFGALKTELVCAEWAGCEAELNVVMASRGFRAIHRTSENTIYARGNVQ